METVAEIGIRKLISYQGAASGNGGGGGSSIVCASLTGLPDFNGQMVRITSGTYTGQTRIINGSTTGGTIIPDANFGGQITTNTQFIILAEKTALAEILALYPALLGAEVPFSFNAVLAAETAVLALGTTVLVTGTIAGGPFTLGELVTGSVSTATGVVTAQTAGTITVVVSTGTFGMTDTLTGAISSATIATLTAITTLISGLHYTVPKLFLKSADPTAGDTVIVYLYTLINSVLTKVKTFTIQHAAGNLYTSYFSHMDMFGIIPSGDNIKITVQQGVGGGPTVVTGDYNYRSG